MKQCGWLHPLVLFSCLYFNMAPERGHVRKTCHLPTIIFQELCQPSGVTGHRSEKFIELTTVTPLKVSVRNPRPGDPRTKNWTLFACLELCNRNLHKKSGKYHGSSRDKGIHQSVLSHSWEGPFSSFPSCC